MSYMDHCAEQDPPAAVEEKYRVGVRIANCTGVIYVFVTAISWEQAHTKALDHLKYNMRVESCLTERDYK